MSGLFSDDTAQKYNKQQQAMTKKATRRALSQFNNTHDDVLRREYERLGDGSGFRPVSYTGPGHNIGISSTGAINMGRTAESQGFMDRLLAGLGTDEAAFSDLLSQIAPGFGRLSRSRASEFDQERDRSVSNLRDQLAKRRVLGASFANHEIGSLERQYMLDKEKALAEAHVMEMEMTNKVINDRTAARNQTISTGLQNIQFETGVGAQLLQTVSSNMQDLQMAMVDIAKLRGTLNLQQQTAKANVVANLAMPGLESQLGFANLESQEKAAPGQLIGTIGGTVLGAALGGPMGASLGGSLFGGGTIPATSIGSGTIGPTTVGNLPWHSSGTIGSILK